MNKEKFYKIKDNIIKRQLVSLYGSLTNKNFRYCNPDLANSLTSTNRVTILGLINHLKDCKHIFSAVDSVIFSGEDCEKKIKNFLSLLSDTTETENNIVMEKKCYKHGIFTTGNTYILIDYEDNFVFKGITKNIFVRQSLEKIIKLLLEGKGKGFILKEIDKIYNDFKKLELDKIVIIEKAVNFKDQNNKSKIKKSIVKYNNFIKDKFLLNEYPPIRVGESIKYFYSKDNSIDCYKTSFPKQKNLIINYEKQFDVLFGKLIGKVLKCFGIDKKTSVLDNFLDF